LFLLGSAALVPGLLALRYVRIGKHFHRDRMLDLLTWRGDEQILDVGTGGGLMLIGAAKRAPRGRAVGVDVWNARDLSGNARQRVLDNAALEGVLERIEVRDEDARALSFPDASFDVVVSTLCLHNIAQNRGKALREIARVLKPGGVAIISDLALTELYVQGLTKLGLTATRSAIVFDTFPFQRIVTAHRPLAR
jgi:ubiquinone/menaquinone biosynthesis C-methylase UbiE